MGKDTRKNVVRPKVTGKRYKSLRMFRKAQEQKDIALLSEYRKNFESCWTVNKAGNQEHSATLLNGILGRKELERMLKQLQVK